MTSPFDTIPDRGADDAAPVPRAAFSDPDWTAKGERRATVPFDGLSTLWINTGTLCNIACAGCYIESSPRNDALAYVTRAECAAILADVATAPRRPDEIGFTGGEPFMNPDMIGMLADVLSSGYRALVLTNAMKPMQLKRDELLALQIAHRGRLRVRVSLDHYDALRHEEVRGLRTFEPAMAGIRWLVEHGFDLAIAGRLMWTESEADMRAGYQRLFYGLGIPIDAEDRSRLVLFPEMDETAKVPEITEECWGILHKSPGSVMCASERMVVKRRGAASPIYVACTLLPYDERFEMGATIAEASRPVALNHPHCAKFCVLGGASCSG